MTDSRVQALRQIAEAANTSNAKVAEAWRRAQPTMAKAARAIGRIAPVGERRG